MELWSGYEFVIWKKPWGAEMFFDPHPTPKIYSSDQTSRQIYFNLESFLLVLLTIFNYLIDRCVWKWWSCNKVLGTPQKLIFLYFGQVLGSG